MESIAAFALACNVVQIVDAGVKAAGIITSIYENGTTEDNKEAEDAAIQLKRLSTEVSKASQKMPSNKKPTSAEDQLRQISLQCIETATKLCQIISGLKSDGSYRKVLRVGVRNIWKKSEVHKLKQKLDRYEQLLCTSILITLREESSVSTMLQDQGFAKLDADLQLFMQNIADGHTQLSDLMQSEHLKTRKAVAQSQDELQAHLDSKFEQLRLDNSPQEQDLRFLSSLKYPAMNTRFNDIDEASGDTFEFIFDGLTPASSDFVSWLKSGSDIFWIKGKAASGKSTMMKYIWQNSQTSSLLNKWEPKSTHILLSHWFWLAGGKEQRNLHGMLCSILHQLAGQIHGVISTNLAIRSTFRSKEFVQDWSVKELDTLLFDLLRAGLGQYSFCVFLDALDEFDQCADQHRLSHFIERLAALENVKVCVSSRPEPFWLNTLNIYRCICLEDCTKDAITSFISQQLTKYSQRYERTEESSELSRQALVAEIARAADGVFLWVHLVVKDVLQGFHARATWAEISKRISRLPRDLNLLYENMLNRLGDDLDLLRREAAVYFQAAIHCRTKGTKHLSFASGVGDLHVYQCIDLLSASKVVTDHSGEGLSLVKLEDHCERLKHRVAFVSGGMLEVKEKSFRIGPKYYFFQHSSFSFLECTSCYEKLYFPTKSLASEYPAILCQFRFSHRTVLDFLMDTPSGRQILSACTISDFEHCRSLIQMELTVLRLGLSPLCWATAATLISQVYSLAEEFQLSADDRFRLLCQIRQGLQPIYCKAIESPNHDDDQAHCLYTQFRSHEQSFTSHHLTDLISCDFLGLTLEISYPCYFLHHFEKYLVTTEPNEPRTSVTDQYKDYLLLCAAIGLSRISCGARDHQSRRDSMIKSCRLLLQAGANPIAEVYEPPSRALKRVAFDYMFYALYNSCYDDEIRGDTMISLCRLVVDTNVDLGVKRILGVYLFDRPGTVYFAHDPYHHLHIQPEGIMVEASCLYFVNHLLKNGKLGCVSRDFLKMVEESKTPSEKKIFAKIEGVWSDPLWKPLFYMLNDEKHETFMDSIEKRELSWYSLKEKLHDPLGPTQREPIDLEHFLKDRGYLKDQDDPLVRKGLIPMFENDAEGLST